MILKKVYQWILPPICILCGEQAQDEMDICLLCYHELPWLKHVCLYCALPLTVNEFNVQICGHCQKNPPPFDQTIALCRYEEPIISFINLLKFSGQLKFARLINKLFIKHFQTNPHYLQNLPECIIPIPLHSQRLRERGFNQALELIRLVASHFDIPIMQNVCERIRATQAQTLIHADDRRRNIKNAFILTRPIKAKHIALIDDVVTTGTTVAELSHLFRKNGVEKIDIWCCARTILKS